MDSKPKIWYVLSINLITRASELHINWFLFHFIHNSVGYHLSNFHAFWSIIHIISFMLNSMLFYFFDRQMYRRATTFNSRKYIYTLTSWKAYKHHDLRILFTHACIHVENIAKEYQTIGDKEAEPEYQEQPECQCSRSQIKLQIKTLLTPILSKASPGAS